MYVSDSYNHNVRKITPAGQVSTWAGLAGFSGSTDGLGGSARFNFPAGLAVDISGTLFVADQNNSTIRKITAAGVVTTLGGCAGSLGNVDGLGGAARFRNPAGIALDPWGNLYVADSANNIIRKGAPFGLPLQITRSGSQVILSWPSADPGFRLESTETLGAADWTTAQREPVVVGGQNMIIDSPTDTARFYRLKNF